MTTIYSPWLYLRDRWIAIPGGVAVFLSVSIWWYILSKVPYTADQVFLHYNIVFGVDLIGSWSEILFPALSGLVIPIINFMASWLIYGSNKFLARFLAFATMVVQVFLLIAVVLMVGLNI